MPEAVDRLLLVADREQVAALKQLEDLELAPVGVLELIHHQQVKTLREDPAHPLRRLQQISGAQLQIVEVKCRALLLAPLIAGAEALQQSIDHTARARRLLIERLLCATGCRVRKARVSLATAAQLRVRIQHHLPDALRAIGRQHIDRLRAPLSRGQQIGNGRREGALAQAPRERLIENRKVRVDACGQRMRTQQPRTEAVEGADVCRLRVARSLPLAELQQAPAHAHAQLAGRPVGERDRQDPRRRDPVLAHRRHEALDQH